MQTYWQTRNLPTHAQIHTKSLEPKGRVHKSVVQVETSPATTGALHVNHHHII